MQASNPSISLCGAASWQLQTAVLLTVLNIHRYMDVDATTMATKRELFSLLTTLRQICTSLPASSLPDL